MKCFYFYFFQIPAQLFYYSFSKHSYQGSHTFYSCVLKSYYHHLKDKESEPRTVYDLTQQTDVKELGVLVLNLKLFSL